MFRFQIYVKSMINPVIVSTEMYSVMHHNILYSLIKLCAKLWLDRAGVSDSGSHFVNMILQRLVYVKVIRSLFIWVVTNHPCLNILGPGQNAHHFAEDISKCIFLNEFVWIPIKVSLKFVPKGPINNIPAMVQIMAWRRPGDKPLSEPMMVSFTDAYMRRSAPTS